MRHILKREFGGYHLNEANQHPPNDSASAESRWRNYRYKNELRQLLLDEQSFLCCYSELELELELELQLNAENECNCHIEHIQPKSLYPVRTFDYQNLAISALSEKDLSNRPKEELFAGHHKLRAYNSNLFISCHQPDCARYFAYLSDGRVVPAHSLNTQERNSAIYTIQTLNLNSPYLVSLRQQHWQELEDLFEEHQQKNWNLNDLINVQLSPHQNRLYAFFTMTCQFFDYEPSLNL